MRFRSLSVERCAGKLLAAFVGSLTAGFAIGSPGVVDRAYGAARPASRRTLSPR